MNRDWLGLMTDWKIFDYSKDHPNEISARDRILNTFKRELDRNHTRINLPRFLWWANPWAEVRRLRKQIKDIRNEKTSGMENALALIAENETLKGYKELLGGNLAGWVRAEHYGKLECDFEALKVRYAHLNDAFWKYDDDWREAMIKHNFSPPPQTTIVKD